MGIVRQFNLLEKGKLDGEIRAEDGKLVIVVYREKMKTGKILIIRIILAIFFLGIRAVTDLNEDNG